MDLSAPFPPSRGVLLPTAANYVGAASHPLRLPPNFLPHFRESSRTAWVVTGWSIPHRPCGLPQ
jgi:hypothetical protein